MRKRIVPVVVLLTLLVSLLPPRYAAAPLSAAPLVTLEVEPNNSAAAAQLLDLSLQNVTVVGGALPIGDQDWFKITVAANSRLWLYCDTGGAQNAGATSRDVQLTLLQSDGTTAVEMDDDDAGAFGNSAVSEVDLAAVIGRRLTTAGAYYLRLQAYSISAKIDPYRLYIVSTTQESAEVEPNDTPAQATVLASTAQNVGVRLGNVANGEEDYYAIGALAGNIITVIADGDPERDGSGADLKLELRSSNGTTVITSADLPFAGSGANPAAEALCYSAPVSGTYYLRVLGFGGSATSYALLGADATSDAPTLISLADFRALAYEDGVRLEWQSGYELGNLGYRLYCDEGGKRTLLNSELIAGAALRIGEQAALRAGQRYAWFEAAAGSRKSAAYWLEDVDLQGGSTWHGPFYSQAVSGAAPDHAKARLLSSLNRARAAGLTPPLLPVATPTTLALSLAPGTDSNGGALRLGVKEAGWYRLTGAALRQAGLPASLDPRRLQLTVAGHAAPIVVTGEADGRLDADDAVEFYGLGLDTPSTDTRPYWLGVGAQPGKRIVLVKGESGTAALPWFAHTVERKDRQIYFAALRNGEAENFFGAVISASPITQTLNISQLASDATADASLEVALQGVTKTAHRVLLSCNDVALGALDFDSQSRAVKAFALPPGLLREGDNRVLLQSQGAGDVSLVEHLRLTYARRFTATANQLGYSASGGATASISGFTDKDLRAMDVTDADNPQEVAVRVTENRDGGYQASVTAVGQGERRMLVISPQAARQPPSLSAPVASRWGTPNQAADVVLIAPRFLLPGLPPLVEWQRQTGWRSVAIAVEDLYDEFACGEKTPQAIKRFLLYARQAWQTKPQYVLLVGDASYDARNYLGYGNNDLVPTKLLDTAYMETASDDWFADFNDDGLAELAVGRLPVRRLSDLQNYIDKRRRYDAGTLSRGPAILLLADRNDGFDFAAASDDLRPLLPESATVTALYRSRLDEATAKQQLLAALQQGQTLVNYAGHGSVSDWRQWLSGSDLETLSNRRLPLVVAMTCLTGYFQEAAQESLAESWLQAPAGGVAVWASSGLTAPRQQAALNQELYRRLFGAGTTPTLGEAMRQAKAAIADLDARRTWVLFGDPTMRVK